MYSHKDLKLKASIINCNIRSMQEQDISNIAHVHSEAFPRQLLSELWISCNYKAFPRIRYFVAEYNHEIIGYIQWTEKSGFRKEVVLELEQMAVRPILQNQEVGSQLITKSLPIIKNELVQREAILKHIVVTTRSDNIAQKLYRNTLNARAETTIPDLFSGDEVLMIARNLNI